MDEALMQFRAAADRENQHRRQRRRYSVALQQQARAYWQARRETEGVRTIAASLGVSVTTLQRWTRTSAAARRFRRISVVASPVAPVAPVAIQITASGPRVEGLTVEAAAQLLALLR